MCKILEVIGFSRNKLHNIERNLWLAYVISVWDTVTSETVAVFGGNEGEIMRIAFVTDGGLKMGMGHIYRSISIAEELKDTAEISAVWESHIQRNFRDGFLVIFEQRFRLIDPVALEVFYRSCS